MRGTVCDRSEALDTEIFERESRLAADKGLQSSKRTFYSRQKKLRKWTGILRLAVKKESGVSEVVALGTENKRLLVLEWSDCGFTNK